jgi:hypothetical protein
VVGVVLTTVQCKPLHTAEHSPMIYSVRHLLYFKGKYWSDADRGSWVSKIPSAKWFRSEFEAEKMAKSIEQKLEEDAEADRLIDVIQIIVPME